MAKKRDVDVTPHRVAASKPRKRGRAAPVPSSQRKAARLSGDGTKPEGTTLSW